MTSCKLQVGVICGLLACQLELQGELSDMIASPSKSQRCWQNVKASWSEENPAVIVQKVASLLPTISG